MAGDCTAHGEDGCRVCSLVAFVHKGAFCIQYVWSAQSSNLLHTFFSSFVFDRTPSRVPTQVCGEGAFPGPDVRRCFPHATHGHRAQGCHAPLTIALAAPRRNYKSKVSGGAPQTWATTLHWACDKQGHCSGRTVGKSVRQCGSPMRRWLDVT